MLDRIEFLISEALSALRRNTWMTFAAVTTSAMALFLLGGIAFAYLGFSKFVSDLGKKAEMKVMISDKVSNTNAKAFADKLLAVPGVSSVRFVPREDGLKDLLKQNPEIDVEGLEIDNPLPNAYVVNVKDIKVFDEVATKIQLFKEVEKGGVKYPAEEQNFLADSMRLVQVLGLVLGSLMLATSGILIYNAIRMTVMARRREIRIMQLVGATRFMVWAPMLIEGVVQGAIGGALAGLVLWFAHSVVQVTVVRSLYVFSKIAQFPAAQVVAMLAIAGATYGFVCSLIAVREPLRLRRSVV